MSKQYRVPEDLLYTETHEWIKVEGDVGTVGITDYAQDQLHDIVYVDLPETGKNVKKGEIVLEIESVKAVAEVYSPVTGEILEINELLNDSPEVINESPYEDGWLFKIRMENKDELGSLISPEEYRRLISK